MFKNLFRRQQKTVPVPEPEIAAAIPAPPKNPFLTVELDLATGKLKGFAYFPRPESEKAAQDMATNFGVMTYLLNSGSLLPLLQEAIVMGGAASGLDGVSHMTLHSLTTLLQERSQQKGQSSHPLVRPTAAFQQASVQ